MAAMAAARASHTRNPLLSIGATTPGPLAACSRRDTAPTLAARHIDARLSVAAGGPPAQPILLACSAARVAHFASRLGHDPTPLARTHRTLGRLVNALRYM